MGNSFRKSLLAAAVCTALAAPVPARAVYLNSDGFGQALIYPYYTAQSVDANPFNTYLTVVNSGTDAKALRVRFREARKGAPVLSFNLFLAPYDAWAGAVVPFGTGTRLLTNDTSCTDPPFPVDLAPGSVPYLDFNNAGYAGDGAGDGLDRTREGFVEILEMATLTGASAVAVTPLGSDTLPNCSAVRGTANVTTAAPGGFVSGTLTLINVASGMDFTVRADALAQLGSRSYYRAASDPYPDFSVAEIDPVSTVSTNGFVYRSVWGRPIDAVSSVLMRSGFVSEYILDTATLSRTDIVVTFPTRRFYLGPSSATAPFRLHSGTPTCPGSAGDDLGILHFNREERTAFPSFGGDYGLPPPPPLSLCADSTVISIINPGAAHMPAPGASGVVGASSTLFVPVTSGFQNGWLDVNLRNSGLVSEATSLGWNVSAATASAGGHTYSGLPVVGFTLRTFRSNVTLTCPAGSCQNAFGGAYPLRFRRTVSPSS